MRCLSRPFSLIESVALILLAVDVGAADRGMDREQSTSRETRAAVVLFENFETVFRAPVSLVANDAPYGTLSKRDAGVLRFPYWFLIRGLDSLERNTSTEILRGAEAVLVGTKDYRAPAGLGPVRSTNCFIVVFGGRTTFELQKLFHTTPVGSVAGKPVWGSTAKLGEFGELDAKASSIFAARVGDYLLVSNRLADLKRVGEQLASNAAGPQTLQSITDLNRITNNSIWGYRRYRHAGIVNRSAAGMHAVTPGAKALIFWIDEGTNRFTLRVLSSVEDEGTPLKINSMGIFGRLKPIGAGGWEKTLPLVGGEEPIFDRLAAVMGLLGFGAWV